MKKALVTCSLVSLYAIEAQAYKAESYLSSLPGKSVEGHPGHAPLTAARDDGSNADCVKDCNTVYIPDTLVSNVPPAERKKWLKCVNGCRKGPLVKAEYFLVPEAIREHDDVQKILEKEDVRGRLDKELSKLTLGNLRRKVEGLRTKLLSRI